MYMHTYQERCWCSGGSSYPPQDLPWKQSCLSHTPQSPLPPSAPCPTAAGANSSSSAFSYDHDRTSWQAPWTDNLMQVEWNWKQDDYRYIDSGLKPSSKYAAQLCNAVWHGLPHSACTIVWLMHTMYTVYNTCKKCACNMNKRPKLW